jgi:chromosome segregation protein
MKLVGIEFHGFKSFADSSQIRFHDGITAIVGPNGCGKSNISDGLRWVLGEQRPTAIRGSRMEEAIFQGTERRKAIHRAEVTLRLSNEDRLLPVPYTEVEISRVQA